MDITTTFDVEGVDARRIDPEDVIGEMLDVFNQYLRDNGRAEYQVGLTNMEAAWAD